MAHEELLAQLSLEQKCALLSGADSFKTRDYPRYGVPGMWLSDGPHGLRKQAGASDNLGINPSEPATCFPTAATAAASWNPELGYELGAALGEEAAAQSVSMVLGPGLNIKRNPLCGRNFEYFSEDPLLAGEMAASYVQGIQSQGVAACPKHFAVNSQEMRRMSSDSIVDERTLREIYLAGFETVVKKGRPLAIMSSYNLVNGTYVNENKHLLQEILRDEWGFDGVVVTDWGAENDRAAGIAAGSTLEMPAPGADAPKQLMAAVEDGRLSEAQIDAAVEKLLDLADATTSARTGKACFDSEKHHALARRIAAQSIVLLKNEPAVGAVDGADADGTAHDAGDEAPVSGAPGILPLACGADAPSVALIGAFAEEPRYQGAGSSQVNAIRVDSLKDMVESSDLRYVGYEPAFPRAGGSDPDQLARAVDLAGRADIVLLCLGLTESQESEGVDRPHMHLDPAQVEVLERISTVNPDVVVLLSCGSPVEVPWLDRCRALVWLGLGGQAGAGAALDVLTGRACPSGHLAETWPVRGEDVPSMETYPAPERHSLYREGPYVGYRYYQTADVPVAFPFGYGLSYTRFLYGDAHVQMDDARRGRVLVDVTNIGKMAGAEVVQLYIEQPHTQVFGPSRQLAGFARVELEPGETKTVEVAFDERALRYWNVRTDGWEYEGGTYGLLVCSSCTDVRARTSVEIEGSGAPAPYEGLDMGPYERADVALVDDVHFETLLGRPLPNGKMTIDETMCFRDLNHCRSPILWLVWAILTHLEKKSREKGEANLNLEFVYNMPLRSIGRMTGGLTGDGVVQGIVWEAKGFWIIGIVRALVGLVANWVRGALFNRRLARSTN